MQIITREDQTMSADPSAAPAPAPTAPREEAVAWIALGFGLWITCGLILVLWALEHGQTDDAFASVYHLPIYLGLAAVCLYCGGRVALAVRRGAGWRQALPAGYGSLGIGAAAAAIGLVVELGWREGIGIGPGIGETMAPTRAAVGLAIVLIAITPLRAALVLGAGRVPRPAMLISAALVIGIAGTWGPFHPAFSPWLEQADLTPYTSGELWIMDDDGSHQTRLVEEEDPTVSLSYASWSPDGRLISYTRFHTPDLDETRADADVWTVRADGTNASQIVDGLGMQWIPRISPDGISVAYTQEEAGGPWANAGPVGPGGGAAPGGGVPVGPLSVPLANADLWQASADGAGEPQRLSDSAGDDRAPVYSPDGSQVLFDSTRDGNTELYLLDVQTSVETRLTFDAGEDWGASWSPDGEQIAFNSDRAGPMEIYVMAADGTAVRRLTHSAEFQIGNVAPSWSPDGSRIAYTARDGNGPGEIWSISSAGGDARNLSRSEVTADELWTGGWGPDGRIVFSRSLPSPPEASFLVREDLGVASMLLSAVLLAVLVVAVVHAGWSFGSFTLVLTVAMALVVLPVEAWRFLVLGPLVGLALDVALYRSPPRLRPMVAGATAAAALVLASGIVIQATSQLDWSPTLLLGVAAVAAIFGWGVGAIGSLGGPRDAAS